MATLNVKLEYDDCGMGAEYLGELTNDPKWGHVIIDISHPANPYYSMSRETGCKYYQCENAKWADSEADFMRNYPKHERKMAPMKWARQDLERLYQYHEGNWWFNILMVSVTSKDEHGNDITIESPFSVLAGIESDSRNDYLLDSVKDMIPEGYMFTDDEILEALDK